MVGKVSGVQDVRLLPFLTASLVSAAGDRPSPLTVRHWAKLICPHHMVEEVLVGTPHLGHLLCLPQHPHIHLHPLPDAGSIPLGWAALPGQSQRFFVMCLHGEK